MRVYKDKDMDLDTGIDIEHMPQESLRGGGRRSRQRRSPFEIP